MESLDKYLWFVIATLHMKEFEEEYFCSFPVSTLDRGVVCQECKWYVFHSHQLRESSLLVRQEKGINYPLS